MNQSLTRLTSFFFIGLDLLILNSILFIGRVCFSDSIPSKYDMEYYWVIVFLNIAWLLISWTKSLYQKKHFSSFEVFCRETMHVYIYFIITSILYLYFYKRTDISRLFMGFEFVLIAAGFFLNRLLYLILFQCFLNKDFLIRKILIIGFNETAIKLTSYLEDEPINTKIIGYCEEDENVHQLSHYPIVSGLSNVINFCSNGGVTEIYSTISPEQDHSIYEIMHQADQNCIRFKIIPAMDFYIKLPVYINYLKDIPILSIRKEPLDDIAGRLKKRIFDLLMSTCVILFILSWMIPIIGLLIWLEDRGPIFFIQKRSGKNNKNFNCIKFRSMRINNEANVKQATFDDERITGIGKILRRSSLDEFPQFLNVFKGHMSVVGPRPHMLKHTDEYSKIINQFMIRQFAKPGLTGWAQINGCRGEIKKIEDIEKRVQYDLWYLENWNLWFDTKIIFLTIYNIIKGDKNVF